MPVINNEAPANMKAAYTGHAPSAIRTNSKIATAPREADRSTHSHWIGDFDFSAQGTDIKSPITTKKMGTMTMAMRISKAPNSHDDGAHACFREPQARGAVL